MHYDALNGTVDTAALRDVVVADNSVQSVGADGSRNGLATRASFSVLATAAAAGRAVPILWSGEGVAASWRDVARAVHASLLRAVWNGTIDARPRLLFAATAEAAAQRAAPPVFDWRRSAAPALARIERRRAAASAGVAAAGSGTSADRGTQAADAARAMAPPAAAAVAAAAAAAAAAYGGAFASLQATAVLTSLSAVVDAHRARADGSPWARVGRAQAATTGSWRLSGRMPLLGSALAPQWAVYPTETPGVLAASVAIAALPMQGAGTGGVSDAWLDAAAAALASAASESGDDAAGAASSFAPTGAGVTVTVSAGWEAVLAITVDQQTASDA